MKSGKQKTKLSKTVFYILLSAALLTYFFIRFPELRHSFSIGTTAPYDFPQDYIAGQQLLSGKSLYPSNFRDMYTTLLSGRGANVDQRINHLNAHPPFTAILLFPLWFLSFHNAVFLWSLLTIFCAFVLSLLLISSEDIPWQYFPILFLFILAWPPFQANLAVGQTSILVAVFVIAGWYLFTINRERMTGVLIALATMLKFYPGLLILYFLINKKYKAFWSSIISMGIILVLVFIVTRYDFFRFIFHIMPADATYSGADIGNLSINGFLPSFFCLSKRIMIPAFSQQLKTIYSECVNDFETLVFSPMCRI